MAKIGKRTNRTREVERPPKLIRPVSAAFWAEILRMAVKTASGPMRQSRKKAAENQPARGSKSASAAPTKSPAPNTPAQKTPAPTNRFSQIGMSGFNGQKPNPTQSPAPRNPVQNRPASSGSPITPNRLPADRPGGHSGFPRQNGFQNAASSPSRLMKDVNGQNSKGEKADRNPADRSPATQKPVFQQPEIQKPEAGKWEERKPADDQPAVQKPVIQNPPTAQSNGKPATLQPGVVQPKDTKPAEDLAKKQTFQSSAEPSPESDAQPKPEARSSEVQDQLGGMQLDDHASEAAPEQQPKNGRVKPADPRVPPVNGQNNGRGHAPVDGIRPHNGNGLNGSTSLFRSGAYSGMTSFRSRPGSTGPEQIPLINPSKPSLQDQNPGKNGNGKAVEPPSTPVSAEKRPDVPAAQPRSPAPQRQPLLKYLLHQHPELPTQSAVFGVGEDGLPVLVDLSDPGPGAVLAISDERQAELDLLRTVVVSLASRNTARGVQFLIFSCDPQGWAEWIAMQGYERHCLAIVNTEDDGVREWVLQLADWTEQRRQGLRSGPPVVAIMDTLSFLTHLDYDVRLNFEWMAKEGPEAQIWPVAAISSDLAKSLNSRRLLRSFQTRILGNLDQPADYPLLTKMDEQTAASFGQPGQFAVQLGDDWLRFRLLALR